MKKIDRIDVINIAQPWVQCIFKKGKNVENNYANKKQRGTVAVYATYSRPKYRFELCKELFGVEIEFDESICGHIVGFVDIVDVIEPYTKKSSKYKKWHVIEKYGFVLENIRLLKKPIPVQKKDGVVRWWHLKDKNLKKVLNAMSASQKKNFKPFLIPNE